jgi:two-component system, OmpR family, sensor histidine kinase VicK
VEDTGCGIPKEDQSYIFDRFFRVDRARSREGGGTGLGLAIVSEIVTKYGGRVWVESEEGSGSSFYFALPAALQVKLLWKVNQ